MCLDNHRQGASFTKQEKKDNGPIRVGTDVVVNRMFCVGFQYCREIIYSAFLSFRHLIMMSELADLMVGDKRSIPSTRGRLLHKGS